MQQALAIVLVHAMHGMQDLRIGEPIPLQIDFKSMLISSSVFDHFLERFRLHLGTIWAPLGAISLSKGVSDIDGNDFFRSLGAFLGHVGLKSRNLPPKMPPKTPQDHQKAAQDPPRGGESKLTAVSANPCLAP